MIVVAWVLALLGLYELTALTTEMIVTGPPLAAAILILVTVGAVTALSVQADW